MSRALHLFIALLFSAVISVSAQTAKPNPSPTPTPQPPPSLKTLPGAARYIDKDKTFSIWLPDAPKSVEVFPPADPVKGSAKTQYKWDLDEGFFAVTLSVYQHRSFDTDKDLAEYLALVKESIGKTPEIKLLSEKSVARENWRGSDLTYQSGDWIRTLIRVLARGNKAYVISVTIVPTVKDAETLVIKAMDSLKITEK